MTQTTDPNVVVQTAPRTIGVALSGGGHRATAWGLGALLWLSDIRASPRVRCIASVSGGSILNGFVASLCDYSRASPNVFVSAVVAPLAMRLSHVGTLFSDSGSKQLRVVVGAVARLSALTIGASVFLGLVGTALRWFDAEYVPSLLVYAAQGSVASLVLVLLLLYAFRVRGTTFLNGYISTVFSNKKLSEIHDSVEHVFCATDLQFAEHVYWSKRFVYSYRMGVGNPGDVPLGVAVGTSAAFPGAFAPYRERTSRFTFQAGAEPLPDRLALLDGGIYDNMADQWFSGIAKRLGGRDQDANAAQRAELLREVVALHRPPDELIVVNASPAFERSEIDSRSWLGSELTALIRMVNALDDNSTSLRRQALVKQFVAAQRGQPGQGTLVHIATNPESSVGYVRDDPASLDEQGQRADAAERLLSIACNDWPGLVERNKSVKTNLDPLGVACVADLLQHAYVLCAVHTHLFLGYPLPPETDWRALFGRSRFEALAAGAGAGPGQQPHSSLGPC